MTEQISYWGQKNCQCLTYKIAEQAQKILNDIEKVIASQQHNDKVSMQAVQKQLHKLQKVVNTLQSGLEVHENLKKEFMIDVINMSKRNEINVSAGAKKLQTVPWLMGKNLEKQEDFNNKNKKK